MKKFASMIAIALLATSMLVSSCKDDDPAPSRTDLLTAKSWSNSKAEILVAGQRVPYNDIWFEACDMDDTFTFSKDGNYTQNIGSVKCDSDDKNTSGTWKFGDSDNTLSLKDAVETDFSDYKVVSMSSTTLELNLGKIIDYDSNGDGKDDSEVELVLTLVSK